MKEPTVDKIRNSIGLTEKWYSYHGKVWVKRYLDRADGTQEYLGEELTPYKELPFARNDALLNFKEPVENSQDGLDKSSKL